MVMPGILQRKKVPEGSASATVLPMWPFRRKREKEKTGIAKKIVVGLIIGGAITSIIGKKLLDKKEHEHDEEDDKSGTENE